MTVTECDAADSPPLSPPSLGLRESDEKVEHSPDRDAIFLTLAQSHPLVTCYFQ